MVTGSRRDNNTSYFQKGLSEWWNQESEYLIQRIEKWTGFSRGYNRLKTIKSIDDDDCEIDENLYYKRKKITEKNKINCCGKFNYQSNNNFDNTCLETYRYDHSIYFKTIGDIKNSKNNNQIDDKHDNISNKTKTLLNNEENIEWNIKMNDNYLNYCYNSNDEILNDNYNYLKNYNNNNDDFQKYLRTVWPNINEFIEDEANKDDDDIENDNSIEFKNNTQLKNHDKSLSRFFKSRKINKSQKYHSKEIISWPSVIFNYNNNMDQESSKTSPHQRDFNIQLNHY
ncbi:putative uncharacterized protein DDB_G0282281 [Aphidius gifuensis]|uniref:putative uncharacterized protein DDB_G0282281 n=1 Tax=Aphidius gifuensis TaxID=684658 RepID=UPI001CDC4C2C|nr:putative uncharacterized protein DDB_G0282281 [Aphidius gifuensis]